MRRETCSACGGSDLRQFLDLGRSPVADAYTTIANEASPTYPLQLAVCTKCWLVQLLEVVDDLFGTGYSFYSSASPPLSAYHEAYAVAVLKDHAHLARRGVVEIGCNDGNLLRHFAAAGSPALGVDPATGPALQAQLSGLDVRVQPFGRAVAEEIRDERGAAGIVIANHVLAHVSDVSDVMSGVAHLLAEDGVAFVEVQYLTDLLVNNAFDLVYHEHRNYFSLSSLEHAAQRCGLHVIDAQVTDRQGGSLRVSLTKQPYVDMTQAAYRLWCSEEWLIGPGAYGGMQGRAERVRERLYDLLGAEYRAGRTIAGYGAPAKATTLLNFCDKAALLLDHVVDTTIAKQGRYIPGTGLRIHAPETAPTSDTYLLLAWNYLSDVVRTHDARWVVPIPVPMVLR